MAATVWRGIVWKGKAVKSKGSVSNEGTLLRNLQSSYPKQESAHSAFLIGHHTPYLSTLNPNTAFRVQGSLVPSRIALHSRVSARSLTQPRIASTPISFRWNITASYSPLSDGRFVTIFTFSLIIFLSSKRPNTRSNHDMALSYLILSFHTSKSHKSRRGKQIVLEYQRRTIY